MPLAPLLATLLAPAALVTPQAPPASAPPQVAWQRTLDDALAVQRATGLPLLIAVNMDGEVFNDRFANTTYRDPAFVGSTEGYVCVVASPDRHTERDYDHRGRRIECPRFPGCTCSEHQAIEPELFRRWFGGRRNAPRHLAVAADGTVQFDRYLDASMQTAIDAIQKHRGTPAAGERTESPWTSRAAAARRQLEARYAAGDGPTRAELLRAAAKAPHPAIDLVRMGLRELDAELVTLAATALASTAARDHLIDLEDALALPLPAAVTTALLERLTKLAAAEPAAKHLLAHWHAKPAVPLPWQEPWTPSPFDANDREQIDQALDTAEASVRTQAGPAELAALANAQLALGLWLAAHRGKHAESWLEDAERTAARLQDAAFAPLAAAVAAVAAWHRSDAAGAAAAAARAMSAQGQSTPPSAWLAAQFGAVAVQSTAAAVFARASQAGTDLTSAVAQCSGWLDLLRARRALDEATALAGIGVLEQAGLRRRATTALCELAVAAATSARVHERLRQRLWVDRGAEGMRRAVLELAAAHPEGGANTWFAGYAALLAAEQHVRDAEPTWAKDAYDAAVEQFAASAHSNPAFADSAQHYAVLSQVGRAALRRRAGDLAGAAQDLLAAAPLRPASFAERDGLQQQGAELATAVAAELAAAGQQDLAQRLRELGK